MNEAARGRVTEARILAYEATQCKSTHDDVVTEEPLEIRLVAGAATKTLAVTMRTPGNDFELAAGFVSAERIVTRFDDVAKISYCIDPVIDTEQRYNIVNVELRAQALPDVTHFERHFTMNSSCGVCGRATLDALVDLGIEPVDDDVSVPVTTLYALPNRMREAQRVFSRTGGLHAAALFDASGELLAAREDIGRHNAVDKLTGWSAIERRSLRGTVLVVSGRASYEILQKAAVARIAIVAAVSAPSSLAIDVANRFGITLCGFLRGERANVYTSAQRITPA